MFICESCLKNFINYKGVKSSGYCDFCHIIKSSGLIISENVLEINKQEGFLDVIEKLSKIEPMGVPFTFDEIKEIISKIY